MASSPIAPRSEARRLRHLSDEKLNEFRNVFAPFREARHAQRHDVQAMIEIFAETAFPDVLIEIARRRRNDADVDRDLLRTAETQEFLLDEHAQDLALRLHRHVGDFVDIERSGMRLFERADLARAAGAILGAEEFFFDAIGNHRGGVEDDERTVGAQRFLMQDRARPVPCRSPTRRAA